LRVKEIDVLILLHYNINSVVTREEITNIVWNDDLLQVSNLLDSAISNIRKVLENFPNMKIRTIYAIGYK
jgi:DNA-binding winged helix-turn-helix (wHTH) protein